MPCPPPSGLTFKLAITPDGDVSFAVKTHGEPLRILIPLGANPVAVGITLSEVSIGLVLKSLLLVKLTANVDTFDLYSLALGIAQQKISALPATKDHHCRLLIHDLYCFVILELAEFPIPIPIFFKELGVDSLGVYGLNTQAHAHFEIPSPGLADFAKVGSELYPFFTDKTYRLPAENPPKILPEFILEDCYIELPKYLGGALIGHKGPIVNIDFNTIFSHLMNGLKFMSLADLLAILPIEYRANQRDASVLVEGFAGFKMNARWLISTPYEFAGPQAAYQRIGVSKQADAEALLKLAPGAVSVDSNGVLVILAGEWELLGSGYSATFVLVQQDMRSVATGLRFEGMLLGMLKASFECRPVIEIGSDPHFESEAHSRLELAGLTIWQGNALVAVDSEQFCLEGDFNLLDETWPIYAKAKVSGGLSSEAFKLDGTGSARVLTVDSSCAVHLGSEGVLLTLNIGDKVDRQFRVTQSDDGQRVEIKGKISLFPPYVYTAAFSVDSRIGAIRGSLETSLVGGLVSQCNQMDFTRQTREFNGNAYFTLFDHNLFEGRFDLNPTSIEFGGALKLFPDGFPVNVIGDTRGETLASGIKFHSGLCAQIGFITLRSPEVALELATDHLAIYGGTWLSYGTINLVLQKQDGGLNGKAALSFGALRNVALGVTVVPHESADLSFDADFAHVVALHAEFNGRAGERFSTSGIFDLRIAGLRLTHGAIEWAEDGFTLSGEISFGLERTNLSGRLDSDGLHLSGGYQVGVELPRPIGLIGLRVQIIIDHQAVGVSLTLPARTTGEGFIAVYEGRLCTLVHLTTWVKDVWIVIPLAGTPTAHLKQPDTWPAG